ncbi:unnamed protein product [Toxocara canis]|nr:unnamed protein product [Toxocara canis]
MLEDNVRSSGVTETSDVVGSEDGDAEDDYMSDVFTSVVLDVRPGIAVGRSQRRIMKIEAERNEVEERIRSIPKRADLEREMRESALSKPIGEESKGFALLAKMGYRPGMSLGKQKQGIEEGIKEPIAIDFKTCRTGLGHKALEEEKKKQRNAILQKRLAARTNSNQFLLVDFRKRQRIASVQKQLVGDVMKSRKACQELDLRNGLELPSNAYFWPIYMEGIEEEQVTSKRANVIGEEQQEEMIFKYSNGKLAPAEPKLIELPETELMDKLEDVTAYLREKHRYCVWCGCQFETAEELDGQCPGSTRADHEGIDDE